MGGCRLQKVVSVPVFGVFFCCKLLYVVSGVRLMQILFDRLNCVQIVFSSSLLV